jgi:hypothetical protein
MGVQAMHNIKIIRFCIVILLGLTLSLQPALAKKDKDEDYGKGRSHSNQKHRHNDYYERDESKASVFVNIEASRVHAIRSRMEPYYYRKCPPGLAKKRNGCNPPGQVKHYRVGHAIPSYVDYWAVPQDVLVLLPPAPAYTQYVWVDRDILLISEASKKVLDAIVLFSAVN